jgi:hypothetical protein
MIKITRKIVKPYQFILEELAFLNPSYNTSHHKYHKAHYNH